MGQSRLQALVMVTTGSFTDCSCCSHGPQSKGQPRWTGFFGRGRFLVSGSARVRSYQAASSESATSCGPCAGQVFDRMAAPPRSTTRAGTASLHTRHRLVVTCSRRSAGAGAFIGARVPPPQGLVLVLVLVLVMG